jgi:DNA polymerase-1
MTSPNTGEPTQAVFGTTALLLKMWSLYNPDYVVVAWDAPGKTFRDGLFADYKATRSPTPIDLKAQVPRILQLFAGFGIPVIELDGLEADDVIACLVTQLKSRPENNDLSIRIVSKDKDLEQLLCDKVTMFDLHTGLEACEAGLLSSKGITPSQVIDLLALTGDTVDNVPGVAGIGPKTAVQLIQEYGSVEEILLQCHKLNGKLRERIESSRDKLTLSKALVTLHCSTDLKFDLESAKFEPSEVSPLIKLFQELGFNRFQDELRRLAGAFAEREPTVTDLDLQANQKIVPEEPANLWTFEREIAPVVD